MSMIGYLLAAVGLYALYTDGIVLGCALFFIGGLLAGKLFFCLRSLGVVIIAASLAYGFHNDTPIFWYFLAVGIFLATFNRNRSSRSNNSENGWGIDFDFSSSGSDGGSCGGDSGGGGGD